MKKLWERVKLWLNREQAINIERAFAEKWEERANYWRKKYEAEVQERELLQIRFDTAVQSINRLGGENGAQHPKNFCRECKGPLIDVVPGDGVTHYDERGRSYRAMRCGTCRNK